MKKVLLLSSVIIILGLTGCSNKYFNDWFSSEQNETDKMCQQIIEACKQQDSEKLKSLFSEESKKNIENLDTEISAFFDYIEGSIQSFEGDCASSSESNYGKRKTELDGMYLILTEKERYCMNFYMYSEDDENVQNVGYIKLKLHWRAKWLRIILYGIIPQTVFLLEDKIDFCYERTLKYKFRMV